MVPNDKRRSSSSDSKTCELVIPPAKKLWRKDPPVLQNAETNEDLVEEGRYCPPPSMVVLNENKNEVENLDEDVDEDVDVDVVR